ncbi:MAG: hypothetical protein K2X66_03880 [Cyanobacteria bacterium]|nr:hypothetical protein [Cyanobacteriota bacterium]
MMMNNIQFGSALLVKLYADGKSCRAPQKLDQDNAVMQGIRDFEPDSILMACKGQQILLTGDDARMFTLANEQATLPGASKGSRELFKLLKQGFLEKAQLAFDAVDTFTNVKECVMVFISKRRGSTLLTATVNGRNGTRSYAGKEIKLQQGSELRNLV